MFIKIKVLFGSEVIHAIYLKEEQMTRRKALKVTEIEKVNGRKNH